MRSWILAAALSFVPLALAAEGLVPFTLLEGVEVGRSLPLRDLRAHAFAYTEDGTGILAIDEEGGALLNEEGTVRSRFVCGGAPPTSIAGAPDDTVVAAVHADGRACVWTRAGTLLGALGRDVGVALPVHDALVALGYEDGHIEGRDPRMGGRRWVRNPDLGAIRQLRAERKGPRIVSASALGAAVIDTRNGRLVRALRGRPAYSAAFSPDGLRLLVGRADGRVEEWDTQYWQLRRTERFTAGEVVDVDMSEDGTQIAVALRVGTGADTRVLLEVFDRTRDELVFREDAPPGDGPARVRFDLTGDRLVAGNGPTATRVWRRPGARQIPRPAPSDEPPHQRPLGGTVALPALTVPPPTRSFPGLTVLSEDGAYAVLRGIEAPLPPSVAPVAPGEPAPTPDSPRTLAPGALEVVATSGGAVVALAGSDTHTEILTLTPDGAILVGRKDDRVITWDTRTGAQVSRASVTGVQRAAALGTRIALTTDKGQVYVGTADRLRPLPGATGATTVAFDPAHADRLGLGQSDGSVRIVDVRTGARLASWGVHAGPVTALSFSRSGQLLATAGPRPGGAGGQLVVLGTDPDDTRPPWSAVLDEGVERLTFSPTGESVLAELEHGAVVSTRRGLTLELPDQVTAAALASDGVGWAGPDGTLRIARAEGPRPVLPAGQLFARSNDGRHAVTVDIDRASVWDDHAGRLLRELPATGASIVRCAFDPGGGLLAILYANGSLEVYDVLTGDPVRNVPGPPADAPSWIRFSDDGKALWVFSGAGEVTAWNLESGEAAERVALSLPGAPGLDPTYGRGRFVRFTSGSAAVWLDTNRTSAARLIPEGERGRPIAADPRGNWIAFARDAGVTRLRPEGEAPVGPVLRTDDPPLAIGALSPDARVLAVAHQSGLVRVWDIPTGREVVALGTDARPLGRGAPRPVSTLEFTPEGDVVIARDADGFPRMYEWRLATESPTFGLGAGPVLPSREITALAVSPDGRTLYSGHVDANTRAWDLRTGAQTGFLWGHAAAVTSVQVVAGGTRVVTGSVDGTARVWNPMTSTDDVAFNTFGDPVRMVGASTDGWRVAALGDGGVLRTWDAARGKALRRWALNGSPAASFFLGPTGEAVAVTLADAAHWTLDLATGATRPSAGTGPLPGAPPAPRPEELAARKRSEALAPTVAAVRSPDGSTLVLAGADGWIRLWDLASGALRGRMMALTDGSWVVDRADGSRYASESLRDGSSPRLYRPPPR